MVRKTFQEKDDDHAEKAFKCVSVMDGNIMADGPSDMWREDLYTKYEALGVYEDEQGP